MNPHFYRKNTMFKKIKIARINLSNLPGNYLMGAPLWSNNPVDWNKK